MSMARRCRSSIGPTISVQKVRLVAPRLDWTNDQHSVLFAANWATEAVTSSPIPVRSRVDPALQKNGRPSRRPSMRC